MNTPQITTEAEPTHGNTGNTNRLVHGLRSERKHLPAPWRYTTKVINAAEKALRGAVAACKGQVDHYDAALIEAVKGQHRHAQLCTRWLRQHAESMNHAERLQYSNAIAKASSEVARLVGMLGLSHDDAKTLEASFAPTEEPQA